MGTRDEEKIGSQKVREKEEEVEARWTNLENKERKKGRKRENWMDGRMEGWACSGVVPVPGWGDLWARHQGKRKTDGL